MSKPLVSIVTPSYNQAAFIGQTIRSVLDQTYPHIEYIVIDGGSEDGSVELIKKYADRLTYWVSEKDNGQADAINKGLGKCTGRIFAYLNSDDLLEPGAVQAVVDAWQQNKDAALFHGKCSTINETGKELQHPQGAPLTFNWLIQNGMLPKVYQPACFFNLDEIKRQPLFDSGLHYVMDYELLLWIKQKRLKSYFIDSCLAQYRWHDSAKSNAGQDKMYAEKLSVQQKYGAWKSPLWWARTLRSGIKSLLRS